MDTSSQHHDLRIPAYLEQLRGPCNLHLVGEKNPGRVDVIDANVLGVLINSSRQEFPVFYPWSAITSIAKRGPDKPSKPFEYEEPPKSELQKSMENW